MWKYMPEVFLWLISDYRKSIRTKKHIITYLL